MKLYLIHQREDYSYDTYDSAVVAAKSEADARLIHPGGSGYIYVVDRKQWSLNDDTWVDPVDVKVNYIGTAKPGTVAGTVICASFFAG